MSGWTLVDTHAIQGRTFQRPLSAFERAFFWEGHFTGGTSDSIRHLELRLVNGPQDAHLFSEANIARAWVSTKRRYPLAGAVVQGHMQSLGVPTGSKTEEGNGDNNPSTNFTSESHFVVRERDLTLLRPHEIVFGRVADAEEAQQRAVAIINGPRPLSAELLVQLYVFRETESKRARPGVLHLMMLMAHCVSDGTSGLTFTRCFLDTLARGGKSGSEPAQMPLEDRLAMVVPAEELEPVHLRSFSPARRRWRWAAGALIYQLRAEKRQGGHTLPCRLTPSTPYTAARSGSVETWLTHGQSAAIIEKCRQHHLTFGNAYLVLGQVAMTRVLYRRYLRGEISEEEWTYRKRQPHIGDGPISLRPYLDKTWFESGGGGEFMMSFSLYSYKLPFMTLGGIDKQRSVYHKLDAERVLSDDGIPPFLGLLTFDRFLYRARLVKKQAQDFLSHPLFFEIMNIGHQKYFERQRLGVLERMKRLETGGRDGSSDEDEILAVTDIPSIAAHGGSSIGNVDQIFPLQYPLPSTHVLSPYSPISHPAKAGYVVPPASLASDADTAATITANGLAVRLHTRPGQLYFGAATSQGRLKLFVFYDGNVFKEEVVTEWLDEVREAVLWYLGPGVDHHGDRKLDLAKARGLYGKARM